MLPAYPPPLSTLAPDAGLSLGRVGAGGVTVSLATRRGGRSTSAQLIKSRHVPATARIPSAMKVLRA
jgi:hypothetical protein